jgi:predicted negative regulator of RcsB-dependent stress response
MEGISLLQTVINGGPALILAVGLMVVWRTWRQDLKDNQACSGEQNKVIRQLMDDRVQTHKEWAAKFDDMADKVKASLTTLDTFTKTVEKVITGGKAK